MNVHDMQHDRAAAEQIIKALALALPASRLDELCRVASTTGNHPALDALLPPGLPEVATALAALTGEPQPLATDTPARTTSTGAAAHGIREAEYGEQTRR